MSFKSDALDAFKSSGIDASEYLYMCILGSKKSGQIIEITHKNTFYQFKQLGEFDNFFLGARLLGDKKWTEILNFADC